MQWRFNFTLFLFSVSTIAKVSAWKCWKHESGKETLTINSNIYCVESFDLWPVNSIMFKVGFIFFSFQLFLLDAAQMGKSRWANFSKQASNKILCESVLSVPPNIKPFNFSGFVETHLNQFNEMVKNVRLVWCHSFFICIKGFVYRCSYNDWEFQCLTFGLLNLMI